MSQNAGTGCESREIEFPFVFNKNGCSHPWLDSINCNLKLLCNISVFVCFLKRRNWPLNTIRESRTVVGGRGVMSTYSIQEVVVHCHTHSPSPLGHGSTHAPLVGVRIEALHRPQTRAAVSTTYCKQSEKRIKMILKTQASDLSVQHDSIWQKKLTSAVRCL